MIGGKNTVLAVKAILVRRLINLIAIDLAGSWRVGKQNDFKIAKFRLLTYLWPANGLLGFSNLVFT
jgi:hypothetical protein